MPYPARRQPASLNAAQVLGPFLNRFDSAGVVLICQQGGQNYFFGQWANEDGLGHVLSWCRTLDPDFSGHWLGHWLGEPGPVRSLAGGLSADPPLELANITDEGLLRHFMRTVDCSAALLVYLTEELTSQGFWRWRHAAGARWARTAWTEKRLWCPVWDNAELGQGYLSPATYEATIQAAGSAHRATTMARSLAHQWSPEVCQSCNRLNG